MIVYNDISVANLFYDLCNTSTKLSEELFKNFAHLLYDVQYVRRDFNAELEKSLNKLQPIR